jgi:hypothetical protein
MSEDSSSPDQSLWLAIILIIAVLAAVGTAVALKAAGASGPLILTSVGAAFVAGVTLGMRIRTFLAR